MIARSDYLTTVEKTKRKEQIKEALSGLNLFDLPVGDDDVDEDEWIAHLKKIKSRVPFACMLDNKDDDRYVAYDANNDAHSDSNILRAAIIAHMCELVDSTE